MLIFKVQGPVSLQKKVYKNEGEKGRKKEKDWEIKKGGCEKIKWDKEKKLNIN